MKAGTVHLEFCTQIRWFYPGHFGVGLKSDVPHLLWRAYFLSGVCVAGIKAILPAAIFDTRTQRSTNNASLTLPHSVCGSRTPRLFFKCACRLLSSAAGDASCRNIPYGVAENPAGLRMIRSRRGMEIFNSRRMFINTCQPALAG